MKVVRHVEKMQKTALEWRREGRKVGFVPTMGFLHEGHSSLMDLARRRAGVEGRVVVSLFVNPTQFSATEDLSRYPRDFERDRQMCLSAGVDVLFAPDTDSVYPKPFSTYVVEEELSKGMEGASRPTHFRGVTTIVLKLFNMVLPTHAVFGMKDFQQVAVVRRMIRDLNLPVELVVGATKREKDGLAMSSRNKYLGSEQRAQATVLYEALERARKAVSTKNWPSGKLRSLLTQIIQTRPEAVVDYIEFFDPDTLVPAKQVSKHSHLALAVRVGRTRLIDNGPLS